MVVRRKKQNNGNRKMKRELRDENGFKLLQQEEWVRISTSSFGRVILVSIIIS